MATDHRVYDVFLTYSGADHSDVDAIAKQLRDRGFRCWYDKWSLQKGQEFQKQIEDGLASSKAVAVFVGSQGLGQWEETEFRAFLLDQIKKGSVPVIPVLLPGSGSAWDASPAFLRLRAPVDFEDSTDDLDALGMLVAGIQGIPPEEYLSETFPVDAVVRPIDRPVLTALQARTVRAYDAIAEKFTAKWFNHPPGEILDLFLEQLDRKGKVLDAGCGPGHHAQYLQKAGQEVIGVDLSKEMLRIANAQVPGVSFRRMDMMHLDFQRASFDSVWCAASALHVPREMLAWQLYEFMRVMRPNGILGISLQVDRVSEVAADGRFFEFYANKAELVGLLSYVGYDVVAEHYAETKRNTHDLDITLKWVTLYCRTATKTLV